MNAPRPSIIAADFDRARQEMLQEFRHFAKAHPEAAEMEWRATMDVMRQLLILDGGVDAR